MAAGRSLAGQASDDSAARIASHTHTHTRARASARIQSSSPSYALPHDEGDLPHRPLVGAVCAPTSDRPGRVNKICAVANDGQQQQRMAVWVVQADIATGCGDCTVFQRPGAVDQLTHRRLVAVRTVLTLGRSIVDAKSYRWLVRLAAVFALAATFRLFVVGGPVGHQHRALALVSQTNELCRSTSRYRLDLLASGQTCTGQYPNDLRLSDRRTSNGTRPT